MGTYYILYNKYSQSNSGAKQAKLLDNILKDKNLVYMDMEDIEDYSLLFSKLEKDDKIIISGGDGTLNHFINNCDYTCVADRLLYFPCGSGNDFARDIGQKINCEPFPIAQHLTNLPVCMVNGKKLKFFNNMAFGVDGYCCLEGDKQREKTGKKANYSLIALKGILFEYKNTDATVTVDGVTHHFKDVLLAPAMKGRYFGGGVKIAPEQNRNSEELTLIVVHGIHKLKALLLFATIYSGKHTKFTKYVKTFRGKHIEVTFDSPKPAQIDGETIPNLSHYAAYASQEVLKSCIK